MPLLKSLSAEKKLHQTIEELYLKHCALLSELVRIPSPIGHELQAQMFVAEQMKKRGLRTDLFEINPEDFKDHPAFVRDGRDYKNRPLVVGRMPGDSGKNSIVLNAHIDTAPIGDREDWEVDPLSGEIRDGKLWGRGAWDDKAGTAIMLLIAESFRVSGIPPAGDLIFQSVIEDEVTGNGTLACLERGHAADGAIILDGTWPERIIDAHMGQIWFRIEVAGRSAPACVAWRGENPIHHLDPILKAFQRLIEKKNDALSAPWGMAERPFFLNVGKISGGHWPGAVPTKCVLECQLGFCPPQNIEDIQKEIRACFESAAEGDPWLSEHPPRLSFWGLCTNPVLGLHLNPVSAGLCRAIKRLRHKEAKVIPVTGHGDIRHFYQAVPAIPACLYGPGEGKNAHVENEYYVLDQMVIVAQNLVSFLLDWWDQQEEI